MSAFVYYARTFKKDKKCIEEYGIQGIAKHTNEIMLQSMCPVTDATGGVSKEILKVFMHK